MDCVVLSLVSPFFSLADSSSLVVIITLLVLSTAGSPSRIMPHPSLHTPRV
jgi:hypothetical protein